ncbi:amidase [Limimonas halophila]|uniref:Amidase n=1 Tax=Limimonas halophila TaxID=1082479 RepID=A0A1G7PPE6_9PROT|nr:amidase [Limimonas halophila]SDF88232.1 amidase [Limimonas halophila]
MRDPLGAFVPGGRVEPRDRDSGPLAGLSFAVKDLFDVAGHRAGCGNPTWKATHPPAETDAPAVRACLDAGAALVGRTVMDELAYSVRGANPHDGAPTNPEAPGRTAGGSSSGAAAAVAGGLADFALGTDTGGSVRVPASYCGLHGLRPTHGAISLDGVMPLAPRFDTVGLLARDGEVLRAAGDVLLGLDGAGPTPLGICLATDAFALASEPARTALTPAIADLVRRYGDGGTVTLPEDGELHAWTEVFRTLQGREAHRAFARWVADAQPAFGPEMAARWAFVSQLSDEAVAEADAALPHIRERMAALTSGSTLIALPCAPDAAPLLDGDDAAWADHRETVLTLNCAAALAGLPQLALPASRVHGLPLGLGLIGPPGSEPVLLRVATDLAGADSDPGARFD